MFSSFYSINILGQDTDPNEIFVFIVIFLLASELSLKGVDLIFR